MSKTALLAMLFVGALALPAGADGGMPEMTLRVVPTPGAPMVRATIIDGPRLPADKIFLVDETRTRIPASKLTRFEEMSDPVAIVLLFGGSEVMVGNATIEDEDSPARYLGYLPALRAAMTALDLVHTMPPSSRGMIISYEDAPRILAPMGPISRMSAEALGTEKDYYRRLGTDLVGGLELAVAELTKSSAPRKILIVVGDGNDTNNEIAKGQLDELEARTRVQHIETYGLIYKGALSPDGEVLTRMISSAQTVPTTDSIAPALTALRERIANQYVVEFPGDKLTWDKSPLYLTVDLDGRTLAPVPVSGPAVPIASRAPEPARYNPFLAWWFQLAMGLGAVGVIALVMRWRSRRNAKPPADDVTG